MPPVIRPAATGGSGVNIADYIVAFLASLGVRHIYGYPGTPLVPLLAALERQDAVRWVLMRHEMRLPWPRARMAA
jgi:TPP-dependent 2-oxoacid decarboxylase